jgi:type I restriction enzyme S subunit
MESVDEWGASITRRDTRRVGEVSKGYTRFRDGDVLVAKITPCMENGKCALAWDLANGIGYGSTEFHVLRAGDDVLPEWLYYFWRYPPTRREARRFMRGSAGQQRVPDEFFDTIEIPLPDLPTQRRIAGILDQADRMRRMRHYALELSDQFLPALFLRMFGDPAENPHGFDRVLVQDLFPSDREGLKCGPFGSALKKHEYVQDGVPVWTMNNVSEEGFREDGCLFVTPAKCDEMRSYSVLDGDILISRAGTVGRMAIARTRRAESIIHTNLIRLSLDKGKVLPEYFLLLMTWFGHRVARLKRGREGAYTFMSTGSVGDLRIPLPDMPLQQRFVAVLKQHEDNVRSLREALRQAEHLFHSLLNQYFGDGT